MTAERLADLHATAFDAPWDAAAFAALLDQSGVHLIERDAGFILIRVVADEAEILTLAVRPEARRAGLGLILVKAAADAAADTGASTLFLEVAEDNAPARALYARAGFSQVGKRPRYYARPGAAAVDALLLSLILSPPLPSGAGPAYP
jgi:[ribosomal protein S18]-alanine N-acetyltransferase